jgi:hypothetical protein
VTPAPIGPGRAVARLVFAVALLLAADGALASGTAPRPGLAAASDSAGILRGSRDPARLQAAAVALASSPRAGDHEALLARLRDPDFLRRLDSAAAYRGSPKRLRLAAVLTALGSNPAAGARRALIALAQSPSFNASAPRADLLIQACASLRPAPPEVVRFWDAHSRPDDGFTPLTIEALVQNGSAPALALLERKLADPRHADDDKRAWMLSSVLTHRNDPALLAACGRWLARGLAKRLKPTLVDALFDYRPTEWFSPATVLRPPPRAEASPAARAELRKIGAYALRAVTLGERQRRAIRETLAGL